MKSNGPKSHMGLVVVVITLTLFAVIAQASVVQSPEPGLVAASIIFQVLLVSGLALWLDRKKGNIS